MENPKVSVWGVAYKGNVDDARETPALETKGARVSVVDCHVKRFAYEFDDIEASVTDADCILLLTDQREFAFFEPEAGGPACGACSSSTPAMPCPGTAGSAPGFG